MQIPPPQDTFLGLANRLTFPYQQNGQSGQLQRMHGTLVRLKSSYYCTIGSSKMLGFFVPHSGDEIGVLAQLMVPSDCKNKDISVRGFKVELCCPSSDSIQAVQDYSPGCVGSFF